MPELKTAAAWAAELGKHRNTLQKAHQRGELVADAETAHGKMKRYYYTRETVEAYFAKQALSMPQPSTAS